MTALTSNDRFISLSPAAGTTVLAYDFELMIAAGMAVTLIRAGVSTVLTLGVDFSFPSGIGDASGGTLTLAVPSLAADRYLLIGMQPEQRLSDFVASQKFASLKMNADLDTLTMIAQEHRRDIGRAVKAAYGTAGADLPAGESDKFIGWNADGSALENKTPATLGLVVVSDDATMAGDSHSEVPTQHAAKTYADTKLAKASNLSDLPSVPTARANLAAPTYVADRTALKALDPTKDTAAFLKDRGGMVKWLAGAAPVSDPAEAYYIVSNVSGYWQRRLSGMIDPTDFDVKGDGTTDDTIAFQRCVTFAAGRDICIAGLTIRIPTGNEIAVPSTGMVLRGKGKIVYEGTGNLFKAGTITTTTYPFTSTAGQTVFAATDSYTGAYVEVYQNGVLKPAWAYTKVHDTTTLTITFLTGGAALNDNVQVKAYRFTAPGMASFSQVIIGSGVEIVTTQVNAGRAFCLGWQDAGFAAGRQFPSFVMEIGATIRGDNAGTHGFTNAIWLHASYNVAIGGNIFGVGGNLIPAGATADDTLCQVAVFLTGELTSSDFHFFGGTIGNYYAAVGSNWSTIEGLMFANFTFLEVGYAVYWLARSNDVGLQIAMHGCHGNCQLGTIFSQYISQCFIGGNDFFQSTKSTKQFFRFMEFEGGKELNVYANTFRSFVTGANCGAVVARTGTRGLRFSGNQLVAADTASVWFGVQCQSGSSDCVIGPNTYENIDQAVIIAAGSDRIGVVTVGDVFITPPSTSNARYSMLGNNWWMDQKWLVLQNAAVQSIATATLTSWVFTEVRDPESLYTSGTLTAPAWARKVRIKGNFKWAANATGQRFVRTLNGGVAGDMQEQAVGNPADNTGACKFDEEFAIAGGATLDIQLYQNSGSALNLSPSLMYVLFS